MNQVTRTKKASHLCQPTGNALVEQRSNLINRVIALLTERKSRLLCNQQIRNEPKEWKNFDYHISHLKSARNRHLSMLFIDLEKIQVVVELASQAIRAKDAS
jgi:hypothetical protein